MELPTAFAFLPADGNSLLLGGYLLVIAGAAFFGGSSVSFLMLGHRRLQVLLSFTGGMLLGVALLHLVPHAFLEFDRRLDTTMGWMLGGFFAMFLLERAFHGHAHHTADGGEPGTAGLPTADHESCSGHGPDPAHQATMSRWGWSGAFVGLALHSLADGAALAAAVNADTGHGAGWLAGLATFLAILLHKPLDAGIIATLMLGAGWSGRFRRLINLLYAAAVPLGAVIFVASLDLLGDRQQAVTGAALALAAGAFLCIAAADLLPEVQFHSHDRILLTVALALGISMAWGITVLERFAHPHAPPSAEGAEPPLMPPPPATPPAPASAASRHGSRLGRLGLDLEATAPADLVYRGQQIGNQPLLLPDA
jgi:zinc and cadmium transporter